MSVEPQKTIVITGANTGLGFFAADQLAALGHRVIIASRNKEKSEAALGALSRRNPGAELSYQRLDLADSTSIREAAQELEQLQSIDVLLLNAGVVFSAKERLTADGFEQQIGTNHLGHWQLVSRLFPKLLAQDQARIVHLGSMIHRFTRLPQAALFPKSYSSWRNYGISKLAVTLFGLELHRRTRTPQAEHVQSIIAHPGFSWDTFNKETPEEIRRAEIPRLQRLALRPITQGKDRGAQPLVMAATDPQLKGGEYIGPKGFQQLKGLPAQVKLARHAHNAEAAKRLWEWSAELTGLEPEL